MLTREKNPVASISICLCQFLTRITFVPVVCSQRGAISSLSTLTRSSITDRTPLLTSARFLPTSDAFGRQVVSGGMASRSLLLLFPPPAYRSYRARSVPFPECGNRFLTSQPPKFPARWIPFAKGFVDKHICRWFVSGFVCAPPSALRSRPNPPIVFSRARSCCLPNVSLSASDRLGECENLVESISEVPRLGNPMFLHGRLYLFPVDPYFGTFEREENSARVSSFLSRGCRICVTSATCGTASYEKEKIQRDGDVRGASLFTERLEENTSEGNREAQMTWENIFSWSWGKV